MFVTIELRMLTLTAVLSIAQVIATSYAASLQRGYLWAASTRYEETPPLRGVARRLDRALHNVVETPRRLPPSSSQRTFRALTMRSPSGVRDDCRRSDFGVMATAP